MADVIQTTQIKDLPDASSLATGDRIPLQKANGTTSDIDYSTFAQQVVNFPVTQDMGSKSVVAGLNELYADRLSVVDDGVITDELNLYYNKEQVNSLISGVQSAYQQADTNLQTQINTLNSNLTELSTMTSTTVEVTYSDITGSFSIQKIGKICRANLNIGNGIAFSNAAGIDVIATLPSEFRPTMQSLFVANARTAGTWATATYYPATIRIATNGEIAILGNANNLKSCQYIVGDIMWNVK